MQSEKKVLKTDSERLFNLKKSTKNEENGNPIFFGS